MHCGEARWLETTVLCHCSQTSVPEPESEEFASKEGAQALLQCAYSLLRGCLYGFYGLTQQALCFLQETETNGFKLNERQRRELNELLIALRQWRHPINLLRNLQL